MLLRGCMRTIRSTQKVGLMNILSSHRSSIARNSFSPIFSQLGKSIVQRPGEAVKHPRRSSSSLSSGGNSTFSSRSSSSSATTTLNKDIAKKDKDKDASKKEKGMFDVTILHEFKDTEVIKTNSRGLLISVLGEIYGIDEAAGIEVIGNEAVRAVRLRDIRRLETHFGVQTQPMIFLKRHTVMFIMDPVRAIVMCNKVYIIGHESCSASLVESVANNISGWSSENKHYFYAFEDNVFEALLTTVSTNESAEFRQLFDSGTALLTRINSGGVESSVRLQGELLGLKDRLAKMLSRVSANKKALADLLEDDERMALMNLTTLRTRPNLYQLPLSMEIMRKHEAIENLLEMYLLDFSGLETRMQQFQETISSSEALVGLRLDTARNQLLTANTYLTILSCAIASGTYITAVFSMNIGMPDFTRTVHELFLVVAAGSFAMIFLLAFSFIGFLESRQIIRMRRFSTRHLAVVTVVVYALFCLHLAISQHSS